MDNIRQVQTTLQMLLSSLPQSSERAMVLRWRDEAELKAMRRENRQKVLAALSEGYDTLEEIMSDTKIPKSTCYKLLKRLEGENLIVKTLARNANNRIEHRFEVAPKNN